MGTVAPGVHRLSHGIANFYVVEEAGRVIVVDSGVRADWELFARELARRGLAPGALSAILLTHAHPDHTGFAERARAELGRPVWLHEADRDAALTGRPGPNQGGFLRYLRYREAWRTLFGLMAHGGTRMVPVREVGSFTDGQRLDLPGRPRILHLPGHTPGMAGIFLEDRRVLFTGDALVTRNPLTGRRGPQIMPRPLNADSARALESLGRIADTPAQLLLPGHGEPWTEGAEAAVRQARAAGLS